VAKKSTKEGILEKNDQKPVPVPPQKEEVRCIFCGQIFNLPPPFTLPKHKNPIKEGQDPLKVSFCVGQGKQGKTIAAIKEAASEMEKEEKRQRERERRKQLRLLQTQA